MTSTNELIERIQKYDGVEKFLILNKNGNKLNSEIKEDDKQHKGGYGFSSNYSEIPRLVDKAVSVVRNIDPLNELCFLQISYSNYTYLIAPDGDLTCFTAINTNVKK
jgi:dynein light chain roadblock-type